MALSDKEKESFPSRGSDNVQPNEKHHNKCVKRLEYSMRRSKFLYSLTYCAIMMEYCVCKLTGFRVSTDAYVKFMLEAMEKVGW